jgi:hypothetical protein
VNATNRLLARRSAHGALPIGYPFGHSWLLAESGVADGYKTKVVVRVGNKVVKLSAVKCLELIPQICGGQTAYGVTFAAVSQNSIVGHRNALVGIKGLGQQVMYIGRDNTLAAFGRSTEARS